MKKISKEVKAIADAHIEANISGVWNEAKISRVNSKKDLLDKMMAGHTYKFVHDQTQARFCSVGSSIMASVLGHNSKAYRAGIYKGFKAIFDGYSTK